MIDTLPIAETNTARDEISGLIRRGCWLLDGEKFSDWAGMFAVDGEYEVIAHSPELKKDMCWWRSSKEQLEHIFKEIPNHIREDAKRAHMVMEINLTVNEGSATSLSRFTVFKTNQRGETGVYAVGHYEDQLTKVEGAWKFKKRSVVLDTRMFDVFPHMIPL